MIIDKGNKMIENNEIITTDTEGIYMRDFADTQVPRAFGYDNRTFTMNVYQYAHNPMELYEANQEQPAFVLNDYLAPDNEQALWKGIPMRLRWNPVVRAMMITGNFRIKYRGCSKTHYGYNRAQGYCLAEYADTFTIYPK
jgi:hypothetical protein|tara:strand:+ start:267 stop:686 length:420 start_codon:yes stop_codon:yes gene_type:complete